MKLVASFPCFDELVPISAFMFQIYCSLGAAILEFVRLGKRYASQMRIHRGDAEYVEKKIL